MTVKPSEVLDFWFEETPPEKRFDVDPALDETIRARFLKTWEEARKGDLSGWEKDAAGALALIVLCDQFPRNMFRGDARSFATDSLARETAKRAVGKDFDRKVPEDRRPFFYMPLMHSENLSDQDLCIALCRERLPPDNPSLSFALKHREVIARFGRFPARNKALGRESTKEETAFLSGPAAW